LGGDLGPSANPCPAGSYPVHAPEARFIGEHDAQPPPTPGGGPPRFPHSIRKAVFLKAFCAAMNLESVGVHDLISFDTAFARI
jgi:hypothetical protein